MPEYRVKLAAALPKGELNGFSDYTIVGALAESVAGEHSVQPRAALMVYDVKKVEIDPNDGTRTVHLQIRRVQPVLTEDGRRSTEQMLADEFAHQTGQAMLPYELSALSKSAFADLPRSQEEIDRREAEEQDLMSPTDELRRHLEVVHGHAGAGGLTADEVDAKHVADHEGDLLGPLEHDAEWIGWTRADLEAAEFEADDHPGDLDPMPDDETDNVLPLFATGDEK